MITWSMLRVASQAQPLQQAKGLSPVILDCWNQSALAHLVTMLDWLVNDPSHDRLC